MGSLFRRLVGAFLGLPKARMGVRVENDLSVPMRDGVVLFANRRFPKGLAKAPVVLMRSPYGRGTLMALTADLLAERGLIVVVQSVRGTAGSGGEFDPIRQERADGADTLEWVRAQPWFDGKLYTFGGSYLSIVIWAMACDNADKFDGAALLMAPSHFADSILEGGSLAQGTAFNWTYMMQSLIGPNARSMPGVKPVPKGVHNHLPLGTIDRAATGKTIGWWQDWVNHSDREDPFWCDWDFSEGVRNLHAPTHLIAGWQDLFLPYQLKDFVTTQQAGLNTWLTVGPWSHGGPSGLFEGQKHCINFLLALAEGRNPMPNRDRLRLYVQGAKEWRDYPSWPPPHGKPVTLHLRSQGRLDFAAPTQDEGASRFTYDPADPTPGIYGPTTTPGKTRDMSELERRNDVISFATPPLERDLEVIGPVSAELSVRSDREHTDFYVCLCDVGKNGKPIHVADGYLRLRPEKQPADASGVRRITIECWPTAYRFMHDHKLRFFVAGGAFPRYARNLGTGEPLATATHGCCASGSPAWA
jgi:uncharacterized protein